ncbi:unnamed protein product [Ilex paraguariensis]|uniref:UDENN domain-containing protein n=1 Tax=Ilex paraguariensis TaxID=185542 RepID=A0ABC8RGT0_9AQUA
MEKNEETGSPGWSASFFMQTTEDVARAVAAAATTVRSSRPSVVFSSKDDSGSQLQKLQSQFSRVLKGFSSPPEVKSGTYNPEILTSQKRQWTSFQLQSLVADNSTLYGCCVLVEEIVQKPSGLISMVSDGQSFRSTSSHHILTTRRCYCILSRLPFFELHFGVLNSIFTEERLERLTKNIGELDLELPEGNCTEEASEGKSDSASLEHRADDMPNGSVEPSQSSTSVCITGRVADDECHQEQQSIEEDSHLSKESMSVNVVVPIDLDTQKLAAKKESEARTQFSEGCETYIDDIVANKQPAEMRWPLLRSQQYDSSESSSSLRGSPTEDRNFRRDIDEVEMEEASFSGQECSNEHSDILEWAKANNHGSLQIICGYYQLRCPARGSTIKFHPLEHLHSLEFHRPDETVLHVAGSANDLKSCSSSLEYAEAHCALMAEEEATALSVWAVACLCGSLRLEHVLTLFAGALLEKQIVVVCSNLGVLSASVLSIIPLIRPYQWQSLLMPVLPNDMVDFLDAPVPYIVGVKNKTPEVQSKLANVILVDANKNQVKSPTIPQLPKQKELYYSLGPYHAKLVGESYLGRKRPVYDCTDVQVEAAKGFLAVLRSYVDSLCSNLRSHTITNVQSNDDKVSLLLKESFIESFPSRDRSFMKLFVDTQLFSVHTDLVLSFFQKE